jgi:hypothetical protein
MSREMARLSFSGTRGNGKNSEDREAVGTGCYARRPEPREQSGRLSIKEAPRGRKDVIVLDHDFEASGSWRLRSWRRGW